MFTLFKLRLFKGHTESDHFFNHWLEEIPTPGIPSNVTGFPEHIITVAGEGTGAVTHKENNGGTKKGEI